MARLYPRSTFSKGGPKTPYKNRKSRGLSSGRNKHFRTGAITLKTKENK